MTDGNSKLIRNSNAEFLIFTAQAGEQSIEARFEDETVWLTQKLMEELFAVSVPTINEHLKNIFDSGELAAESVIRKFRITAADGKSYATNHYNLDASLSVMRRPLIRRRFFIPRLIQRPHLPGERFADGFQPFDPLLLLVDRLVQLLDLVFLESEFGFDVDEALFAHGDVLGTGD